MHHRLRLLVPGSLVLFALGLAGPADAARGQDDPIRALVASELERAQDLPAGQIWERALALRDAADSMGAELDPALDAQLGQALIDPSRLLFLTAARLLGSEPDAETLSSKLLELTRSERPEVVEVASDLLTKEPFRRLSRGLKVELATQLLKGAQDVQRDPRARLDVARAAFRLGGGTERRLARTEMLAFLDSSDPGLRGQAALALAQTGEEVAGALADELEQLSRLPGPTAELALAYLDIEREKRVRESKLKSLQERFNQELLPEEFARVEAVLDMVAYAHLDGDKVTRDELIDAGLQGMLSSLDRHSTYMSPEGFASFMQDLDAEYGGIGAYVGEDPADGLFTITRPIYSGPAYSAGIQTDDKIVRVDDWPTLGQPTEEVIKRLKGKPGTSVKLYIWRRGMQADLIDRPTEDMIIEVERGQIEIPAVYSQMLPGGIGLVELWTFSAVATRELERAIGELLDQGMTGLIFDLRRNSGGYLPQAVSVANLFLPPGLDVVTTDYRVVDSETLRTTKQPLVPMDVPMVVLTSRYTASASEIVAGALQDHERATLIGERSFGKGSVQNLLALQGVPDDEFRDENRNGLFDPWEEITVDYDGDGEFDFAPRVKMTIARYLLPSGRSIHREFDKDGTLLSEGGVVPEVEVAPERIEAWRYEERLRLRDQERIGREYADRYFDDNRELFGRLALSDGKDPLRWPGFDELYDSLDTPLPKDDVRQILRAEIRRRVQDDRGGEFPFGDFEEDVQVQAAVTELLRKSGRTVDDIQAFVETFVRTADDEDVRTLLLAGLGSEQGLETLLSRLREARERGDALSREDLDRLIEALDTDGVK
jgi:C-terminal peptidase prc